jgi:hypothetical protein
MATPDEIGREKNRIAERLARVEAERTKLADQLNELEIAERVLTRFGGARPSERRRQGRRAGTAPAASTQRRARGSQQPSAVSLSDATLRAVLALGEGATASDVMNYLTREFGMTVRPNHLGIALQRLRRAGRLENRDGYWFQQITETRPGAYTAGPHGAGGGKDE